MISSMRQRRLNRHRLFWAYLRRRPAFNASPAVVTVETTTRCNLNCSFCHRAGHPQPPRDMSCELFRKLVEEPDCRIDTINLFGMGEPLLDPWLMERLALCRRLGIKTHVATNATLLDETASRELLTAGLDAITFSVDSVRPDVYEQLRVGATYSRTVRNILYFLERCRAARRRPVVLVQMLRTNRTEKESNALKRFWLSRGVDDVRLCRNELHGPVAEFAAAEQRFTSPSPCPFLWQGPALVRADGGLYSCCNAGLDGRPLANLESVSLFEFWTSERMTALRRARIAGRCDAEVGCRACQSQKPVPWLATLACLADGITARRWGIRAERMMDLFQWRLLYRENT